MRWSFMTWNIEHIIILSLKLLFSKLRIPPIFVLREQVADKVHASFGVSRSVLVVVRGHLAVAWSLDKPRTVTRHFSFIRNKMRKLIFILLTSSLSVLFNISCSPSDSIQDEEIPPTEDKGEQPSPTPSEDKNEMKTVDLGLSVEWADKNYNSKDSYDVGDYVENYTQKGAPIQRIYNVPKEFDIPNAWQARELLRMCKWIVQEKDGHKYFKVIGPNGNHIIMPMGGNLFKQLQTFEYYNKDKKAEYLYESDGYGMQEFYMDENGRWGALHQKNLFHMHTSKICKKRR